MKRFFFVLIASLFLFISGCSSVRTDITRAEVIDAYEAAGYLVYSDTYKEMDSGAIAYVQANHPDGDYIYFTFFDNPEDAKAYEKDLDHPVVKYFFSGIYGDPSWERLETYGCIVVSYDDPQLFSPFEALLK